VSTSLEHGRSLRQETPTDRRHYTQIPLIVHELAETSREYELMAALISFRWHPWSPIIPSVETLRGMLRCSARTIRRTAARLEARGYILREERRAGDNRQLSNVYHLCGPLLAAVTRIEDDRVQEDGQSRPGGRSNVAGKPEKPNENKRTRRTERVNTDPAAFTSGELGRWIRT
jgi:DNA-binding transcriptional MocR family regulator